MALPVIAAPEAQEMTARDWAAIASVVVAFVALLISVLSSRTARKSLRLSERQEERRSQRLVVYLNEALAMRFKNENHRLLSCSVFVSNPSDSPNTLVSADLHLNIVGEDGVITEVKVPPTTEATAEGTGNIPKSLAFPVRIEPRGAASGRILFRVDDRIAGDRTIDGYVLVVKDINQRTESIDISLFRDVIDAEADR
jgi:hypothetical protein